MCVRVCGRDLSSGTSTYSALVAAGDDCFTEADEASLKMFGIYCSLAVSFGALHERSQKKVRQRTGLSRGLSDLPVPEVTGSNRLCEYCSLFLRQTPNGHPSGPGGVSDI